MIMNILKKLALLCTSLLVVGSLSIATGCAMAMNSESNSENTISSESAPSDTTSSEDSTPPATSSNPETPPTTSSNPETPPPSSSTPETPPVEEQPVAVSVGANNVTIPEDGTLELTFTAPATAKYKFICASGNLKDQNGNTVSILSCSKDSVYTLTLTATANSSVKVTLQEHDPDEENWTQNY